MIIILYVMDSLRPDFLSCYGHAKQTSPHIDRLAREGVIFTHAFAQSTWTRPSGASILSSRYVSSHGVFTYEDVFPPSIPCLPQMLNEAGYHTIALSSMGNISPDFGFGRGFDQFVELYKEESVIRTRKKIKVRNSGYQHHFRVDTEDVPIATSDDINRFLFPLLEEKAGKDLFVLVWSLDTHTPFFHRDEALALFSPPSKGMIDCKAFERTKIEDELDSFKRLYEDMIYYNDHHLGKLIERLQKLDLYKETLFILTGDHGEAFGEHGFNGHAREPYDELLRVPLILKFPRAEYLGTVSNLVQHIDLVPTLLDYAAVSQSGVPLQGRSLLPLLRDRENVNEFAFSEYQLDQKFPRHVALRTENYKYVEVRPGRFTLQRSLFRTLSPLFRFFFPKRLLFHLNEDPGERTNRIRREKGVAKELRSRLRAVLSKNEQMARGIARNKRGKEEVDEKVASQLKALGYFE